MQNMEKFGMNLLKVLKFNGNYGFEAIGERSGSDVPRFLHLFSKLDRVLQKNLLLV